MRWPFQLSTLPVVSTVVVFALSNRETVLLAFWPFVHGLAMPLCLAVLIPLVIGYIAGRCRNFMKKATNK